MELSGRLFCFQKSFESSSNMFPFLILAAGHSGCLPPLSKRSGAKGDLTWVGAVSAALRNEPGVNDSRSAEERVYRI